MFKAICELESVTPYSQGKFFNEEKPKDITHEDFEKQTWRKRMHSTPDGKVYIPAMAFKNSLAEAAKYKSIQIPGKGKSTYTKHFESGILVVESLILDKKIDEVDGEWKFWQSGNDELRRQALEYLANDLAINARIAERMGVL